MESLTGSLLSLLVTHIIVCKVIFQKLAIASYSYERILLVYVHASGTQLQEEDRRRLSGAVCIYTGWQLNIDTLLFAL